MPRFFAFAKMLIFAAQLLPASVLAQEFSPYLRIGGPGNDKIVEAEVLPDNTIMTAGTFTEQLQVADSTFISAGNEDIWLLHLDSNLQIINATAGGSRRKDEITDLKITPGDSSILLSGSFWGSGMFFGDSVYAQRPGKSIFIIKMTYSGNVINKTTISGTGTKEVNGIVSDTLGNIYMTGSFSDSLFFSDTSFKANYDDNFFVAKIDSLNRLNWFYSVTGDGFSRGNTIDLLPTDSNNLKIEIIAGGDFIGSMFTETDSIKTGTPEEDNFYIKFSDSGTPIFLRKAGGVYPSFCKKIKTDKVGNFYLAGDHKGVIKTGDGLQIETEGLNHNLFVLAFDREGNSKWGRSFGSSKNDGLSDFKINHDQLLFAGFYEDILSIDAFSVPAPEGFFNALFGSIDAKNGVINRLLAPTGNGLISGTCIDFLTPNRLITGFEFSENISLSNESISSRGFFDIIIAAPQIDMPVSTYEKNSPQLNQPDISIIPNPTDRFISLKSNYLLSNIRIYDLTGRVVFETKSINQLDISSLPKGVYIISCRTNNLHLRPEKLILR